MQPYVTAPPVLPPSPFVWGTRDWITATLGHDFRLGFEEGILVSRFASAAAALDAYTEGFGPVRAIAEALDVPRRNELQAAFMSWVEQFHTDLGIGIPLEYLVSVGQCV